MTGIGEIEGGEVVLTPAARARDILSRLSELEAIGVAGVILVSGDQAPDVPQSGLPIILVPAGSDVRQLQADIGRYITRRRRELFAYDQELHQLLVERALSGHNLRSLLDAASVRAGRMMALDRDGDLLLAGRDHHEAPPHDLVFRARTAQYDFSVGCTELAGVPPGLAVAITDGKQRHGIALLVGHDGCLTDEDEATVTALASACAIALTRQPASAALSLDEVLTAIESSSDSGDWVAFALTHSRTEPEALLRALSAELSLRNITPARRAVSGRAAIALLPFEPAIVWEPLRRAIGVRLGSTTLKAAVGRGHTGPGAARRSAQEALETLERGPSGQVTSFESIELAALLSSTPRWRQFARSRLAPLLDVKADHGVLVNTLGVYLASGRNAKAAAGVLQVHRNTLLYRLRRIEQCLGVRLDDPEILFSLELATRVLRLDVVRPDAVDDSD